MNQAELKLVFTFCIIINFKIFSDATITNKKTDFKQNLEKTQKEANMSKPSKYGSQPATNSKKQKNELNKTQSLSASISPYKRIPIAQGGSGFSKQLTNGINALPSIKDSKKSKGGLDYEKGMKKSTSEKDPKKSPSPYNGIPIAQGGSGFGKPLTNGINTLPSIKDSKKSKGGLDYEKSMKKTKNEKDLKKSLIPIAQGGSGFGKPLTNGINTLPFIKDSKKSKGGLDYEKGMKKSKGISLVNDPSLSQTRLDKATRKEIKKLKGGPDYGKGFKQSKGGSDYKTDMKKPKGGPVYESDYKRSKSQLSSGILPEQDRRGNKKSNGPGALAQALQNGKVPEQQLNQGNRRHYERKNLKSQGFDQQLDQRQQGPIDNQSQDFNQLRSKQKRGRKNRQLQGFNQQEQSIQKQQGSLPTEYQQLSKKRGRRNQNQQSQGFNQQNQLNQGQQSQPQDFSDRMQPSKKNRDRRNRKSAGYDQQSFDQGQQDQPQNFTQQPSRKRRGRRNRQPQEFNQNQGDQVPRRKHGRNRQPQGFDQSQNFGQAARKKQWRRKSQNFDQQGQAPQQYQNAREKRNGRKWQGGSTGGRFNRMFENARNQVSSGLGRISSIMRGSARRYPQSGYGASKMDEPSQERGVESFSGSQPSSSGTAIMDQGSPIDRQGSQGSQPEPKEQGSPPEQQIAPMDQQGSQGSQPEPYEQGSPPEQQTARMDQQFSQVPPTDQQGAPDSYEQGQMDQAEQYNQGPPANQGEMMDQGAPMDQ
jgi:hypothetical protein